MPDSKTMRIAARQLEIDQPGVASIEAMRIQLAGQQATINALNATVTALQGIVQPAFGTVATPALSLTGSTADVTVNLSRTMPNTSYNASPIANGGAAGKVTIVVKSRTTASVTVTLTATAASVPVATLTIICWA